MADYLASPDAIFKDDAQWRYGTAPDYSKTRQFWRDTKSKDHAAGSLEEIVENLVKSWEVEASFKPKLEDWRTIDKENYSFAINGGEPQTAEFMLGTGTYNAILAAGNDLYSPKYSDFNTSHKTFKRMMPAFAWEVLEVYSGPPVVAFRWRHWGEMKSDYVGFNDKGEKVTAKAHGGMIDIQGVTVAKVDDKVRLQKVETWFDPMEMFRQISPDGVVNREIVDHKVKSGQLDEVVKVEQKDEIVKVEQKDENVMKDFEEKGDLKTEEMKPEGKTSEQGEINQDVEEVPSPASDKTWEKVEHSDHAPVGDVKTESEVDVPRMEKSTTTGETINLPSEMEEKIQPAPGEAVVAREEETRLTHEEMRSMTKAQCPFFNQE